MCSQEEGEDVVNYLQAQEQPNKDNIIKSRTNERIQEEVHTVASSG